MNYLVNQQQMLMTNARGLKVGLLLATSANEVSDDVKRQLYNELGRLFEVVRLDGPMDDATEKTILLAILMMVLHERRRK